MAIQNIDRLLQYNLYYMFEQKGLVGIDVEEWDPVDDVEGEEEAGEDDEEAEVKAGALQLVVSLIFKCKNEIIK